MNIQNKLYFEPISKNAPPLVCNACGNPSMVVNYRSMARLLPFVNEGNDFNVVACCKHCERRLLDRSISGSVNRMIADGIWDAAMSGAGNLKDEYALWLAENKKSN